MIDFEKGFKSVINKLDDVGKRYAEAKAVSWQLQEMRKVILADEMRKAQGGTNAEKENIARTSAQYMVHLDGTKEAIQKELTLKAEYEALYARYEALRSLSSQYTKSMTIGEG